MFIDFLKSLVFPSYMQRHRYMSVLFPILIFGLTIIILVTPYRTTLENSRDELIYDEGLNVVGFYELEDDEFDYTQITAGDYKVEAGEMSTSLPDDGEYEQYKATYVNDDGKTVNVHFIFDIYSDRDRVIKETTEVYDDHYDVGEDPSQEVQNKRAYVTLLTYIELVKNPDLDVSTKIDELQGLSLTALETSWLELTYFDYYNIATTPDEKDYLMIFNSNYMEFQTPIYDEAGEKLNLTQTRISVVYYDGFVFDVDEIDTLSDLGKKIATTRVDIEILRIQQQYIYGAVIVVLLYTLIIVLIFWLFFRRRGALKKFKEYYNIAGLASIIPTIITFIVLWFIPDAITLYGVGFSLYYVFVLYRISKLNPVENIDK